MGNGNRRKSETAAGVTAASQPVRRSASTLASSLSAESSLGTAAPASQPVRKAMSTLANSQSVDPSLESAPVTAASESARRAVSSRASSPSVDRSLETAAAAATSQPVRRAASPLASGDSNLGTATAAASQPVRRAASTLASDPSADSKAVTDKCEQFASAELSAKLSLACAAAEEAANRSPDAILEVAQALSREARELGDAIQVWTQLSEKDAEARAGIAIEHNDVGVSADGLLAETKWLEESLQSPRMAPADATTEGLQRITAQLEKLRKTAPWAGTEERSAEAELCTSATLPPNPDACASSNVAGGLPTLGDAAAASHQHSGSRNSPRPPRIIQVASPQHFGAQVPLHSAFASQSGAPQVRQRCASPMRMTLPARTAAVASGPPRSISPIRATDMRASLPARLSQGPWFTTGQPLVAAPAPIWPDRKYCVSSSDRNPLTAPGPAGDGDARLGHLPCGVANTGVGRMAIAGTSACTTTAVRHSSPVLARSVSPSLWPRMSASIAGQTIGGTIRTVSPVPKQGDGVRAEVAVMPRRCVGTQLDVRSPSPLFWPLR